MTAATVTNVVLDGDQAQLLYVTCMAVLIVCGGIILSWLWGRGSGE